MIQASAMFLVASICLYSTGHWIGGTVAMILGFLGGISK